MNNNEVTTDQNTSKVAQQNSSPRKQYAPQDSMGQILKHNPQMIKPKSTSPFRPLDQPKDSFYFVSQQVQTVQSVIPKVDAKNHQFHVNDQLIKMNDRQRKQVDLSSNVFEQAQISEILTKSPERKQLINSSVQWSNVHYGKTNTQVNEKAEFDKDYAKQRKQTDLQQQYIDGTKHKSPSQIIENEVNIQSKKQNQQFSDLFGQEYGDKERNWMRPQRSLSPQMKWNTFDSIRNVRDFGDMNIKESKLKNINSEQQKETYKKSHPVTQPFFDCKMSFEKIKGQYTQKYQHQQQEIGSQMKFGQEKKMELTNSNKKYSGIYSWKNNYVK